MKVAYILLAHSRPHQLLRVVRALDHPDSRFLVHVDGKAPPSVFRTIRSGLDGRRDVIFLRRRTAHWGGFGIVDAVLEGVHALATSDDAYDYAVFLTGQDYPIKPLEDFHQFLAGQAGRSFLDVARVPSPRLANGGTDRFDRRHWYVTLGNRRLHVPNRYFPWTTRVRVPDGIELYIGSAYWALTPAAVASVDQTVREQPGLVSYLRRTAHPSESFFQVALMNSPLRDTIVSDDLHYIDWSENLPSPKTLTVDDLPALEASPAFFARKFDENVDTRVLDELDLRVLGVSA
ncbi:MAG: beta-1,6-N-acetylglucosaminyltransferase [Gaiellaceae bacterium]|jgi:hypothetical protein